MAHQGLLVGQLNCRKNPRTIAKLLEYQQKSKLVWDILVLTEPPTSVQKILIGAENKFSTFICRSTNSIPYSAIVICNEKIKTNFDPAIVTPNFVQVGITYNCNHLFIISQYFPSNLNESSTIVGHLMSCINKINNTPFILTGDFNGHSNRWQSNTSTDLNGSIIERLIDSFRLSLLNSYNAPTWRVNNRASVIDLTLCNEYSRGMVNNWKVNYDYTDSDHSLITFVIGKNKKQNFAKLNFQPSSWNVARHTVKRLKKTSNLKYDCFVDQVNQAKQYLIDRQFKLKLPLFDAKLFTLKNQLNRTRKKTQKERKKNHFSNGGKCSGEALQQWKAARKDFRSSLAKKMYEFETKFASKISDVWQRPEFSQKQSTVIHMLSRTNADGNVESTTDSGLMFQWIKEVLMKPQLTNTTEQLCLPDDYCYTGEDSISMTEFSNVNNEYEISLNSDSTIEEGNENDSNCPQVQYNFVPIRELDKHSPGTMIDVVGVVTKVERLLKFSSDGNNTQYKRILNIIDQSKITISLHLWGNLAGDFNSKPGCVVIAQQAKVDNKKGTLLSAKYLFTSILESLKPMN